MENDKGCPVCHNKIAGGAVSEKSDFAGFEEKVSKELSVDERKALLWESIKNDWTCVLCGQKIRPPGKKEENGRDSPE